MNNSESEHRGTLQVVMRLLRQVMPGEWRRITVGSLLLCAVSGAVVLQPWPLKLIIDSVLGGQSPPELLSRVAGALGAAVGLSGNPKVSLLLVLCLGVLGVEALIGLFRVSSNYVLSTAGLRMVFRLRCIIFDHIQRLSPGYHNATTVGDSLYRVTSDTQCAKEIFAEGVVPAASAAVTLAGIALVMFSFDSVITLTALSVVLPLLALIRWMDKRMASRSQQACERESGVSTTVHDVLTGIRAVQAFGGEERESRRFKVHAHASCRATMKFNLLEAGSQAAVDLFLAAGVAVVAWLAVSRVFGGSMTVGDVVLLVSYIWMLYEPLAILSFTAGNIQGAAASVRRVFEVLDTAPDIADARGAAALPGQTAGCIAFENVSFGYGGGRPVFSDVSLEIPAGSKVAIVGPSGSGKTTFAGLIVRFYDPSSGRVTLDGFDLRSLKIASLRQNIAIVTQEPMLFDVTVRENIAYGKPGATMEEIRKAARSAGAHEFIESLPEQYETRVGGQGQLLSAGQRQRLAIARAFLKDAPILILDEPTSSLDNESEALVMESLGELMRGRTTIIIAHRLSIVQGADRILMVKKGRIIDITGLGRGREAPVRPTVPELSGAVVG
jgi:ABC-type multidrug transport system fused ATPase/permease subunit